MRFRAFCRSAASATAARPPDLGGRQRQTMGMHGPSGPVKVTRSGSVRAYWGGSPPQPSRDGPSGGAPDSAGATASFGSLGGRWEVRAADAMRGTANGRQPERRSDVHLAVPDNAVVVTALHPEGHTHWDFVARTRLDKLYRLPVPVRRRGPTSGNHESRGSFLSAGSGMLQKFNSGRWCRSNWRSSRGDLNAIRKGLRQIGQSESPGKGKSRLFCTAPNSRHALAGPCR